MGGADNLVVLPSLPVAFFPHAVFIAKLAMAIGK
jgi:hypothetical protein